MPTRIGINGFGRIGGGVVPAALESGADGELQIRALAERDPPASRGQSSESTS